MRRCHDPAPERRPGLAGDRSHRQVLEVRSIDGRLRFARKGRDPDAGDQPKKAFDPEEFYGPDYGPDEQHASQSGDTGVGDEVTGGDDVAPAVRRCPLVSPGTPRRHWGNEPCTPEN